MSTTRVVVPPHATVYANGVDGEQVSGFSFVRFLVQLLADPAFGETPETIYQAAELRGLFRDAHPGDVVDVPDSLMARLLTVARAPKGGYNPALVSQAPEYLRALLTATPGAPPLRKVK